jgi:hypothetical protein
MKENNLLGKALKAGYQSHYVVTDNEGNVADLPSKSKVFNEFVIEQV